MCVPSRLNAHETVGGWRVEKSQTVLSIYALQWNTHLGKHYRLPVRYTAAVLAQ